MPDSEKEFLTVQEAMQFLGVSRATLDSYARDGKVKRYEQGAPKRTMYKREELAALKQIKPKQ